MTEIEFIINPKPRKACKYCSLGSSFKTITNFIYCPIRDKWMKFTDGKNCENYIFDSSNFDEQYEPTGLKD